MEVYDPLEHTDPVDFPLVSAETVFLRDRREVLSSDLLIALLGQPSLGEGMELELARSTHLPMLLLMPTGLAVSKMVQGMPAVKQLLYFDSEQELTAAVVTGISTLNPKIIDRRDATKGSMENVLGRRIRALRIARHMSCQELADEIGTTVEDIEFYESNPDFMTNLGVPTLRRLASSLEVDVAELVASAGGFGDGDEVGSANEQGRIAILARGDLSANDATIIKRYMASRRSRVNPDS
jgi:transcriptional regulator with XRE-family HTH domain